LLIVDSK